MRRFELPRLLPIFPLPDVVLFPDTHLPLHLFEPRYRQLGADVAAAGSSFGMVLLRPPARSDAGHSAIFSVGCTGPVTDVSPLPDGRINLVLAGEQRFRVLHEAPTRRLYRVAEVEPLDDPALSELGGDERGRLDAAREQLERLVARILRERGVGEADAARTRLAALDDPTLVHTLASGTDLDVIERQSLLECDGLVERAERLLVLLTMQRAQAAGPTPRSLN